jgi:hypothetical protein
MMRTTLEIDDDILAAAKELAARQQKTAGKLISELARKGIHAYQGGPSTKRRNGFEYLPAADGIVPPELLPKIMESRANRDRTS